MSISPPPSTLRQIIGDAVEALIGVLDAIDRDPDLEADDPFEANGDEQDTCRGVGE